jgi:uncharacterized protein
VRRASAPFVQPVKPAAPNCAVIDTNAVLDGLVFGDADATALMQAVRRGRLVWLTTPRMRAELSAVLMRPLSERWENARKLALTIDTTAIATPCDEPPAAGTGIILNCSDPSDQMFIDLALAHGPSLLITRDRALLALRRRAAARGVVVCTAAEWRQRQAEVPPP